MSVLDMRGIGHKSLLDIYNIHICSICYYAFICNLNMFITVHFPL